MRQARRPWLGGYAGCRSVRPLTGVQEAAGKDDGKGRVGSSGGIQRDLHSTAQRRLVSSAKRTARFSSFFTGVQQLKECISGSPRGSALLLSWQSCSLRHRGRLVHWPVLNQDGLHSMRRCHLTVIVPCMTPPSAEAEAPVTGSLPGGCTAEGTRSAR